MRQLDFKYEFRKSTMSDIKKFRSLYGNLSKICAATRSAAAASSPIAQQILLTDSRQFHDVVGDVLCPSGVRGIDHLRDPRLNKPMDFYYMPSSAPCRAVIMTAKALGIDLNKHLVNLFSGEHLKPKFLQLNPQHTVPTLVDNGFVLWESRAIIIYLAEKYDKDDLYPKCPKKRGVINQRLFFDAGTLYKAFFDTYSAQYIFKKPVAPQAYNEIDTAFELLNIFLDGQTYAAGDSLTLADISLLATVSTFDAAKYDVSKYANVARWYESLKETVPGWEENWAGALEYKKLLNN